MKMSLRVLLMLLIATSVSCGGLLRDQCLDRGGCWDESRKACELRDQGRCSRKPIKGNWTGTIHGAWPYAGQSRPRLHRQPSQPETSGDPFGAKLCLQPWRSSGKCAVSGCSVRRDV